MFIGPMGKPRNMAMCPPAQGFRSFSPESLLRTGIAQHAGIQNPHFYKNVPKLLLPNNLPIYFRPVDLSELSGKGEFTVF